jgi:tripeptidyl-peptidase I
VISTSYGDDEQTVSYAYAVEVCNKYTQFGVRGVSLLYASGDYGAGADGTCFRTTGRTCLNLSYSILILAHGSPTLA